LHIAVRQQHEMAIDLCLANNVSLDKVNKQQQTPVDLAETNSQLAIKLASHRIKQLLIHAIRNRQQHNIKPLYTSLLQAPPINLTDHQRNTPLHLATRKGDIKTAETLLPLVKTYNLANARNIHGDTALMVAIVANETQMALWLLEQHEQQRITLDVDIQNSNGAALASFDIGNFTALHLAAKRNQPSVLTRLLMANANPTIRDYFGFAPIHWAAYGGNTASLEVLCNTMETANTHIDIENDVGQTALHLAANQGHLKSVQVLINAQADIEAKDNEGKTPLFMAAKSKSPPIVVELIMAGANPNATDNSGQTAMACINKHIGIGQLFWHAPWSRKMACLVKLILGLILGLPGIISPFKPNAYCQIALGVDNSDTWFNGWTFTLVKDKLTKKYYQANEKTERQDSNDWVIVSNETEPNIEPSPPPSRPKQYQQNPQPLAPHVPLEVSF